jgi:hypothetical protein
MLISILGLVLGCRMCASYKKGLIINKAFVLDDKRPGCSRKGQDDVACVHHISIK